jgi:DNA polymerase-1
MVSPLIFVLGFCPVLYYTTNFGLNQWIICENCKEGWRLEKLLIVDGCNLLFQMFCGMPARILNSQGKAIQGTLGFTGALLKMIRMVRPTHVAVLFDGEGPCSRVELDPDYKANRPPLEEENDPFTQLPDVYRVLDHLGICHAETQVCEFDDWAAGYAKQRKSGMEVVIASQDSDFFQLIDDHVTVLRYRGDLSVLWDRDHFQEKFGIRPEQYADFKSLTGDTADNIRGAEKVGPKTAAALMEQFGDLETLLARSGEITKPSIRASISECGERLKRNQKLIRLDGSAELPFPVEQLAYTPTELTTNQILMSIGLR